MIYLNPKEIQSAIDRAVDLSCLTLDAEPNILDFIIPKKLMNRKNIDIEGDFFVLKGRPVMYNYIWMNADSFEKTRKVIFYKDIDKEKQIDKVAPKIEEKKTNIRTGFLWNVLTVLPSSSLIKDEELKEMGFVLEHENKILDLNLEEFKKIILENNHLDKLISKEDCLQYCLNNVEFSYSGKNSFTQRVGYRKEENEFRSKCEQFFDLELYIHHKALESQKDWDYLMRDYEIESLKRYPYHSGLQNKEDLFENSLYKERMKELFN